MQKDNKTNLSLKGPKSNKPKQRGASTSSKTVTIQVKRKRLLSKKTDEIKKPSHDVSVETNQKSEINQKQEVSQKQNINEKTNKQKYQIRPEKDDNGKNKRKIKSDKDQKIENFEEKELHLKTKKKKGQNFEKKQDSEINLTPQHQFEKPTEPVKRDVEVPSSITVGELAQKMAVKSSELIKVMMGMGVMATINQSLDQDTAILIVEEMGHIAIGKDNESEESILKTEPTKQEKVETRPPIVTIMGHVDHGKTSLLDYIRKTKIVTSEAGGITQHIGAYRVKTEKGTMITFLDTPGHAAFSAMRARGAQITDIIILVVSADDGVMPQTEEAIEHAQASKVPIIVAINKIDKENADPEKVQNELGKKNVIPEEWGGDTIFAKISALNGDGIDNLLDSISLQAEILELKASKNGPAAGTVIESSLDKGRGPVATILVKSGTLHKKDFILVGKEFGRVRAMYDEFNNEVLSVEPGCPAVVTGLSGTPNVGDQLMSTNDEKKIREVASMRESKQKEIEMQSKQKSFSIDDFNASNTSNKKRIENFLIKTDVQGSCEAITTSLQKIDNEDVGLEIIYSGVGGINESDVNLAQTSNAKIIGFNVRADSKARKIIEANQLDLKYFSVIYDLLDNVKQELSGLLEPDIKEEIIGIAEVKDVFRSSKFGAIAGSMVVEGTIQKEQPIRVLRDNVVIYEGELESLRRFKDDVKEVKSGTECGIGVKNYNDIKNGDQIEVYKRIEIKRSI